LAQKLQCKTGVFIYTLKFQHIRHTNNAMLVLIGKNMRSLLISQAFSGVVCCMQATPITTVINIMYK